MYVGKFATNEPMLARACGCCHSILNAKQIAMMKKMIDESMSNNQKDFSTNIIINITAEVDSSEISRQIADLIKSRLNFERRGDKASV